MVTREYEEEGWASLNYEENYELLVSHMNLHQTVTSAKEVFNDGMDEMTIPFLSHLSQTLDGSDK